MRKSTSLLGFSPHSSLTVSLDISPNPILISLTLGLPEKTTDTFNFDDYGETIATNTIRGFDRFSGFRQDLGQDQANSRDQSAQPQCSRNDSGDPGLCRTAVN